MKKLLILISILIVLFGGRSEVFATLLWSENFSGSADLTVYPNGSSTTISDFISSSGNIVDAKYGSGLIGIVKDTMIKYSSPASIQLYGPGDGFTCEFWTPTFTGQNEIWVSWAERLSSDWTFGTDGSGHKWILFQMAGGGYTDPYLSWQTWGEGDQGLNMSSRIFAIGAGQNHDAQVYLSHTHLASTWFKIKIRLKLNTAAGTEDGIIKVWYDEGAGWTLVSVVEPYYFASDEALHMRGDTACKIILSVPGL